MKTVIKCYIFEVPPWFTPEMAWDFVENQDICTMEDIYLSDDGIMKLYPHYTSDAVNLEASIKLHKALDYFIYEQTEDGNCDE